MGEGGYRYGDANPIRRVMRSSGAWPGASWLYARTLHHLDRAVWRLSGERATFVSWVTGMPIVLLTTTGAKSGARRTLPLVAIPADDKLIVVASNYGQPRNPAWYHNLKAHPKVIATFDGASREMTARVLEGEERERWYERGVDIYPGWVEYRRRTAAHRQIPVIELSPAR